MNCPKCKDVALQNKNNGSLFSCPVCGGIWLTQKHFEQIPEMIHFETGGHKNPAHDSKTGLCPEGHGILTRAKVDLEPSFFLEKCSKCNGIWFDKGEWQKIFAHKLENNLLDLWSLAWQREQRKNKRKEELEQQAIETIGIDLYSKIKELAKSINEHPNRYRAMILLNEELGKQN